MAISPNEVSAATELVPVSGRVIRVLLRGPLVSNWVRLFISAQRNTPHTQDVSTPPDDSNVIHAAGGILWRTSATGRELKIIRRTRYGLEWALPKGKVDSGESWTTAALREVAEETGCTARIGLYGGGQVYLVQGVPKVVLYWNMELISEGPVADTTEVVETRWVSAREASSLLTHTSERALLPRGSGFSA